MDVPARVSITEEADVMVKRLAQKHGPLMFHQSGGCCDGSAPMCYPAGEFRVGGQDVLLGHISDAIPVWMGAANLSSGGIRSSQLMSFQAVAPASPWRVPRGAVHCAQSGIQR